MISYLPSAISLSKRCDTIIPATPVIKTFFIFIESILSNLIKDRIEKKESRKKKKGRDLWRLGSLHDALDVKNEGIF